MKIGQLTHSPQMDRGLSATKAQPGPSGFRQVFNETLQRNGGAPHEPSPVLQPQAAMPCSVASIDAVDPLSGMQAMEDFIDALEGYQQRLENPANGLRDIAPSMERLERAQHQLVRFASQAPADSPLGSIMNEGLVTAAMEIQRFHSGVYC